MIMLQLILSFLDSIGNILGTLRIVYCSSWKGNTLNESDIIVVSVL